jgi:hypothetical protein
MVRAATASGEWPWSRSEELLMSEPKASDYYPSADELTTVERTWLNQKGEGHRIVRSADYEYEVGGVTVYGIAGPSTQKLNAGFEWYFTGEGESREQHKVTEWTTDGEGRRIAVIPSEAT